MYSKGPRDQLEKSSSISITNNTKAKFNYTIDPSKPAGFIDGILINMVGKDKLNKNKEATMTAKRIANGDEVELLYRAIKDDPPNHIKTVIGSHQIPEEIEKSLMGLKVGDTININITKKDDKYRNIEILSIRKNL